MRRPLDWFVVSLSLGVLLANRLWVNPAESLPAAREESPSPFAYVREDGTETYLRPARPARQARAASSEDLHANSAVFDAAVYTWSSPVLARETGEGRWE
jgi:hypothetical protein